MSINIAAGLADQGVSLHEKQNKFIRPSSFNRWAYEHTKWLEEYIVMPRVELYMYNQLNGTNVDAVPKEFVVERREQTPAMSMGSAFDSLIKGKLVTDLGLGDGESFAAAQFAASVDPQNLELVTSECHDLVRRYIDYGCYAQLLEYLRVSDMVPQFEVPLRRDVSNLRIGGTPDIVYDTGVGKVKIIMDWKVTGYFAERTASPHKGYYMIWPKMASHKDMDRRTAHGFEYNGMFCMSKVNEKWANQMTIYSWLSGNEVGGEFYVVIHQTANRGLDLRVAEHRLTVTTDYQEWLYSECMRMQDEIANETWDKNEYEMLWEKHTLPKEVAPLW
jgi:hypothetical protein